MNDFTTKARAELAALSNEALSKQFRRGLTTYGNGGKLNPFTEEEQTFLNVVSPFVKLVGHADFGKMLRVGLNHDTADEATYSYHKALRQVDAFPVGNGYADSLLYQLLNLPECTAFWGVFERFFFPKDAQDHVAFAV